MNKINAHVHLNPDPFIRITNAASESQHSCTGRGRFLGSERLKKKRKRKVWSSLLADLSEDHKCRFYGR